MVELAITITDPTHNLTDATQVSVQVRQFGRAPATVAHATLHGVMSDMLPTYVQAAVEAWAYEGSPRDVARACAGALSLARRHARTHERRGGA